MKSLRALIRGRKFRTNMLLGSLILTAVFSMGIKQSHATFNSVEVKFTDASQSGLAIVPASCPSNPGDGDAPYGCSGSSPLCPNGSAAPNDDVNQCTCAQGNVAACLRCPNGDLSPNNDPSQCTCLQGNISACVTRCPDGSTAPNGDPKQCTCAQGNQSACTSSCPVGYRMTSAGQCVFSGCPAGYTLQGSSCIGICGANQHAVGSLCVCDSTNLPADSNGKCTMQVCPNGYLFDPGTGKCVAINQCFIAPACSDLTHAINRCTGAITNCALNGAGWVCQNGLCIKSPPPIASISGLPSLLAQGKTSNIAWTSQNTDSCTVTGNNGDGPWAGTSGSHISKPILSQTIYTLTCLGLDKTTITKTLTINIIPNWTEN